MKTSINAWSVDPSASFEQTFADIKAAGFDGIELNVDKEGAHSLTVDITDEKLAEIKALSEKYELPVVSVSCALWWGNHMGRGTEEGIAKSKELLCAQIRCAEALGAQGILIVPSGDVEGEGLQKVHENCKATLRALKDVIENAKVKVGVENVWNGFFTSPFDMRNFVVDLNIKNLGCYYDIGNTIAFSYTASWLEILGKYITNLHIKGCKNNSGINSGVTWSDISESSVDWKQVRAMLDKIGWTGYVTAEVGKNNPDQSWTDYYKMVHDQLADIIL